MRNFKLADYRSAKLHSPLQRRLGMVLISLTSLCLTSKAQQINFVFFSDPHYGTHRMFRGVDTPADQVLEVMQKSVKALPAATLPDDGGVGSGQKIEKLDFIVCGGDIGNRMHGDIQSAAASWAQFERTWINDSLPPVYLIPGNHDISNAIGYPTTQSFTTDPTCVVEIYNRMMHPAEPRTTHNFVQRLDKSVYAFAQSGIAFLFGGAWIDSESRRQLELTGLVNDSTPAILFTHFPAAPEAFRFTNPHPGHDINAEARYQNVIEDIPDVDLSTDAPVGLYREAARFLGRNPQIAAWLHGHSHCNFFYEWTGPDEDISIKAFQTDSPTLGALSSKDELIVSYLVVSIDPEQSRMTVRQYFWHPDKPDKWGISESVALR
jgi:hypothetical protein